MEEQNFLVNKFLFFQEKSQDDYFYNALIYIFEHNENGALGLIINKSLPIEEENFSSIGLQNISSNKSILNGGPVEVTKLLSFMTMLTKRINIQCKWIMSNFECRSFKRYRKWNEYCKYKLALGYCGWDAGQLDYEVSKNSWHIIDFNS